MNTTSEQLASTSSAPAAIAKPWSTVVQIGQHLERELGLERSNDTLARWMAHRIAELMEQANKARTAAARRSAKVTCTDLIIRLWEKRAHLPSGAPLAAFADFLENFVKQKPLLFAPVQLVREAKTWAQALPIVNRLLEQELKLWQEAALAAQPHRKARKLVHRLEEELEPHEARVLRSLANVSVRYEGLPGGMFSDPPGKRRSPRTEIERDTAFRKAISKLTQQRAKFLQSIGKHRRRCAKRIRRKK